MCSKSLSSSVCTASQQCSVHAIHFALHKPCVCFGWLVSGLAAHLMLDLLLWRVVCLAGEMVVLAASSSWNGS
jgi:hypothetical protein